MYLSRDARATRVYFAPLTCHAVTATVASARGKRDTSRSNLMAARDSLAEVTGGAFDRSPSTFLSTLGSEEFPIEAGRYAVYVSLACPWACRVLAALQLKGLDFIDVVVCSPTWQPTLPAEDSHCGWVFRSRALPGSVDASLTEVPLVDPHFHAQTIREVYTILCKEAGIPLPVKFTVPLLVCYKTRRIVCNESSLILRGLGGDLCNALAKHPQVDLYPTHLWAAIEAANTDMYDAMNNGVYKCGFATTQEAYSAASASLSAYFDRAEQLLSTQRYLCGPELTEADIRLYVTLVRFDAVYQVHFKCIFRSVRGSKVIGAYVKDVHRVLGGGGGGGAAAALPHPVTNLVHIKQHYFGSHPKLNPYGIVPTPHPREGVEWEEDA